MADNDWKARLGMVYSTDPDYHFETAREEEPATLPPAQQELRVWLDRKQRGGKQVTLVRGSPAQEPLRCRRLGQGGRNHHPG